MGNEVQKAPEITLLKSEMEAAAARVAEKAMNTTLDGIAGVMGDVFGGLLGDGIKQWRTRRLVTGLVKTKDHLEAAGISIANAKSLPMGELYAIFDGMSKQEDPQLTDMWAALLANSMNPKFSSLIDPSFSKVLERLSGIDSVILKFYFEALSKREGMKKIHKSFDDPKVIYRKIDEEYREYIETFGNKIVSDFGDDVISSSISNLLRNGLLFVEMKFEGNSSLVNVEMANEYELNVDDSRLREEISGIYYNFDLMVDNVPAHKVIHYYLSGKKRRYYLPYDLTSLAKRLIKACGND